MGDKIILPTTVAIFAFGLVTSSYFYPNLLSFQAESIVGKKIAAEQVPKDMFYSYRAHANCLDFYSDRIVEFVDASTAAGLKKGTLIFTDQIGMEELSSPEGPGYKIISSYDDYNVTGLSFEFLLKDRRKELLEKKYLLEKI